MMASPGAMLQPCCLPGQAGFLSYHCPYNTTVPSCCWQIAAGTHFQASFRCLRAFSQQTALLGTGEAQGHPWCSTPLCCSLEHTVHSSEQSDGEYLVV